MPDDDETPPDRPPERPIERSPKRPQRPQTQTERDTQGAEARRKRDAAARAAYPEHITDEITGKYEGEELVRQRAKRPTAERVERLEVKHDELVKQVGAIAVDVGGIRGEMKVLPELVDALKDAATRAGEHETLTLTARLDVDKAKALDPIEANKARREWVTKGIAILGAVTTGVLAILQARQC